MPANYDLPENGVVKRVRYFDGLFLKDQDFIDDQKYHTDRQRRPNLLLRVAGICDGLTVLVESNQVKVTSGSALDNHGRLIVLSETLSVDLKGQAGEVDLYISYQEEASDITQANNDKSPAGGAAAASSKGAKGATRWWENPRIEAVLKTAKPTAEDTIWLGRVTVSGTTVQGNPNLEFRQYSGVYLPSSASPKNGPTLRSGGNVNPTLAVLTGGLSITGNVGIGTTTVSNPQGWNRVLEIFGTGNARLNVRSSGEVITSVFSHDNWNGARGLIGTVSNHPLTFVTNYTHQMTIDGVGNVGIGTPSPAAKLAINGGLHVGGDSDPGDNNLEVDGNSTISGALNFGSATRQMINLWGSSNYGIGVQNSTQYFRTDKNFAWYKGGSHINDELGAGTSGKVQMVIKDGKVGIGTTSPGQALTVTGTTDNAGKHEGSGMTNGGILAIVGNAPQIDFIDTDHNDWSIHVNSNKMYFVRQPWEFKDLVLDGAGNVGIGTDTPGSKLDVVGTVKATKLLGEGAFVQGMIIMWGGAVSAIPTGWALCNGQNGTPDLRSRFIVGAGDGGSPAYKPGDVGEPDQHSHTIDAPSQSFATDAAGSHSHVVPGSWYKRALGYAAAERSDYALLDTGGAEVRGASVQSGGSHTHTLTIDLSAFTSGSSSGNNRPKWYAVCFIIKL
jgi:hypothetical protein